MHRGRSGGFSSQAHYRAQTTLSLSLTLKEKRVAEVCSLKIRENKMAGSGLPLHKGFVRSKGNSTPPNSGTCSPPPKELLLHHRREEEKYRRRG